MKLKNNNNIFCAVSAGLSSVLMALKIKEWYPNHNIIFAMSNTSKERQESLDFMNECDKHYNIGLIWIEAVINQERGKGTDFKIVSFNELKRNGEIFEEGIKKYGVPSKINKWCNRELKVVPLKKFADSIFGLNNYSIAVGLRIDEIDRISKDYKTNNTFYPLIDNKISSRDRNKFWDNQPVKISIPAYKGNCDFCFEKSVRKLTTIMIEEPEIPKWWEDINLKYGSIHIEGKYAYNGWIDEHGSMNFFRDNMSIDDLTKLAQRPFKKATDEYIYENDLFDSEGDCGSGCKVF
jgi:hypothetical protein